MSDGSSPEAHDPHVRGPARRWLLAATLVAAALLAATLAVTIWSSGDAPPGSGTAESKPPPRKPDFEFQRFSTQIGAPPEAESGFKPGHWTPLTVETVANNFDFRGELSCELLDSQAASVLLPKTSAEIRSVRPAVLPKGQIRSLDTLLFPPPDGSARQVSTRLLSARAGADVVQTAFRLSALPAYQWYLLVLAAEPTGYRYLRTMDCVRAPRGGLLESDVAAERHYRVLLPQFRSTARLPESALAWTATAYVVWDGFDPALLSPTCQRALVDWLHWGGQLVISGPGSLDMLRGSFLEPYLPAGSDGTCGLDRAALAPLSEFVRPMRQRGTAAQARSLDLDVLQPWSGEALVSRGDAAVLLASAADGPPLAVERPVGRGRVVVTAFRLNQRELVNWHGFDTIWNACLLRRGSRVFDVVRVGEGDQIQVGWHEGYPLDPRLTCRLRFWSRDSGPYSGGPAASGSFGVANTRDPQLPVDDAWDAADELSPRLGGTGVAAWSDTSSVARVARQALREAAGIAVPPAAFVLGVVTLYVVVLVPVNGLIFRLLGRVEWAWAAAPLVAIAFAGLVIHWAQLDIGFARARTEIAVMELQPSYSRAHVTRFTALYNSLGTRYDLLFDDPTALALPLAAREEPTRSADSGRVKLGLAGAGRRRPDSGQAPALVLGGLEVGSNTTSMVHSEQMLDLGGAVTASVGRGRVRLRNGTGYNLRGAVLVDAHRQAVIGDLPAGVEVEVRLAARQPDQQTYPQDALRDAAGPPLDVRSLLALAAADVADGELRLVAWTSEPLPGLWIEPSAAQLRYTTVVAAHLSYPPLPPPKADQNTRPLRVEPPPTLGPP